MKDVGALLKDCRSIWVEFMALLMKDRALCIENWALYIDYLSILVECRTLLIGDRALFMGDWALSSFEKIVL